MRNPRPIVVRSHIAPARSGARSRSLRSRQELPPWLAAAAAVCAVAMAFLLAACGTATTPGAGNSGTPGTGASTRPGGGTSSSPATAAQAKVALSFTVSGPNTATAHWTLRCDPPGGTEPDAAAACAALLRLKQPFIIQPRHIMCPMIMPSARRIVVTGTWFGQKVHRIVVDGGCDLGLFGTLGKWLFR
jgi:hypothetical protein